MTEKANAQIWLTRIVIYIVLSLFAFIMLFPFIYMMSTSFKNSTDVFTYPPRLLPYTTETREYNGEQVSAYTFEIDGQTVEMVATGEKQQVGSFTDAEGIDLENPRESAVVAQVPLTEEMQPIEERAVTDAEGQPLTNADGEEVVLPVYAVEVEGETRELYLVSTPRVDVFVNPDNPEQRTYAVERLATQAEAVEFQVDNYNIVFGELNLNRALINTTLVTLGVTVGQLITSIFGGYAFSRVNFRGRDTLFVVYLGSIMIPFVVLIIPMYRLMVLIGWENRIVSLIVPWIFTAYGTFLMRQFFITIPKEIEEAALLDGCSRFRILWTIFVPLSTPAVATLAIFSFLYAWNSFLWPLLIIGEGNETNHVLTLSLIRLSNIAADRPNLVLTGAAIAILPPILVFIFAQKYFIEGLAVGGVKG
ncbi:MAG: carbohydrate ABC transporter permease [bacterium]|nr:carbohydrate ABC transporter permease [bacterium]